MTDRKSALRYLGLIIFIFGIILGVLLCLARAIPDLEATMYGFTKYGYPKLTSLRCPLLMTISDRQNVTIKLANNLDRSLNYYVVAQFSSPILINSVSGKVELQPGETKVLSWEVGNENVSLGNFIFARVYTTASAAHGMKEALCGTFVINYPLTGGPTIYYIAIIVMVLCLALGIWLWRRYTLLSESNLVAQYTWMRFNGILVVLSVAVGFMDWWFFAILSVIGTILTSIVFLIPRKI
jgi:hypothetical protein